MSDVYNNVKSYIGCGKPWAEDAACMACECYERFAAGEINESELRELLMDVARVEAVIQDADDLEIRNGIVAAIAVMGKFA